MIVRPLAGSEDDAVIRELFRSTFVLGRPLEETVPGFERYESLCLDWYLGPERQRAAILDVDGTAAGYVLVCTDGRRHRQWVRPRATRFALAAAATVAARRGDVPGRAFLRTRLRDGWALARTSPDPVPVHAHVNLAPAVRGGAAGRLMADHVDAVCRAIGAPSWFGEINAVAGRRAAALERLGATIVHRAPNHTLSRLLGRPVERLTVVRTVPGQDLAA